MFPFLMYNNMSPHKAILYKEIYRLYIKKNAGFLSKLVESLHFLIKFQLCWVLWLFFNSFSDIRFNIAELFIGKF